ncbi:MAG: hypothetical protein ACKOKF_06780 [Bacteroidota bacterium]
MSVRLISFRSALGPIVLVLWLMAGGCALGDDDKSEGLKTDSLALADSLRRDSVRFVKTDLRAISQEKVLEYAQRNPCYLPMLADTSLYESGCQVGFTFQELFNEKLPADHPYRNRYIVGDFNVLNADSSNRGVQEIDPLLSAMIDFKDISDTLLQLFDGAIVNDSSRSQLDTLVHALYPDRADLFMNFFDKVWKYKTPPIVRKYGVAGSSVYAAGQHVCMCEAYEDTLLLVGKFAISGKRQSFSVRTLPDGRTVRTLHESLPINSRRSYYGGRYRISSKNWETQRRYELLDIKHDSLLGGGNNQVTYFQGKAQLPNFLLMHPVADYPEAMTSNGIHEVALAELSRGMLGSPNSIGCVRVTDFGSKFLRWWTPQNCNFFILYDDDRYVWKLDSIDAESLYPFKTKEEGDRFRRWINEQMPEMAKSLDIDPEGDHKNGFVIDAYTAYKKEYEDYLKSH